MYNNDGCDLTSFKISLGRDIARHYIHSLSDADLYVIGDYINNIFMQGCSEWFEYKIDQKADKQRSFIVPTVKAKALCNECFYADVIDLPVLIPPSTLKSLHCD